MYRQRTAETRRTYGRIEMRHVLIQFLAFTFFLVAVYLVGATGCNYERPEPDCEPPDPSECEYDGQILWPEPLCAYECVFEKPAAGPREI